MKTLTRTATGHQKTGGIAALYLAAAYLLAVPFFLLVVDTAGVTDPAHELALLAPHHWSVHAMYLVTYVIFGIALAVLALALHQRLRAESPALMQAATVAGLLWAVALVASGLVYNAGLAAAVSLYPADPSGAASLWRAVEPVANGLGGSGGELLGGLWVLLVSIAALRQHGLSRALAWLGVALGLLGLASVAPPLRDAAIAFGLLQIVWFAGIAVALLRTGERTERALALEAEPA